MHVHMQTQVTECNDASEDVYYDGEKVFTTNGPS